MSTHTPGPWMYRLEVSDFIIETQPHAEDIAVIHSNLGGTNGDKANARLIAAAPELFQAAIAYFAAVDAGSSLDAEAKAEERLRAAIAKAEG